MTTWHALWSCFEIKLLSTNLTWILRFFATKHCNIVVIVVEKTKNISCLSDKMIHYLFFLLLMMQRSQKWLLPGNGQINACHPTRWKVLKKYCFTEKCLCVCVAVPSAFFIIHSARNPTFRTASLVIFRCDPPFPKNAKRKPMLCIGEESTCVGQLNLSLIRDSPVSTSHRNCNEATLWGWTVENDWHVLQSTTLHSTLFTTAKCELT